MIYFQNLWLIFKIYEVEKAYLAEYKRISEKMPFQRGPAPIRRTVKYLKSCPLVFKERVKVLTVNYNEEHRNLPKHTKLEQHQGAKDFVFWNLQQVMINNKILYS